MDANIPNEPGSWDLDWSYAYLERLYGNLRRPLPPFHDRRGGERRRRRRWRSRGA
jgi:hypothetical protein